MLLVSLTLLSTGRVNFEFFDTPERDILLEISFHQAHLKKEQKRWSMRLKSALFCRRKLTGQKGSLVNHGVGNIESVIQEKDLSLVMYLAGTLDHSWLNLFLVM